MKLTDFSEMVRNYIRDQWMNFRRAYIEPEAREELLGGGRIYFYAPNTYTAVNVYADAECSIPLPNPVIFDSHGEIQPVFKSSESVDIKIVNRYAKIIMSASPADQLFGP